MSSSEEPSTNKPRPSIFNGIKRRTSSAYESASKLKMSNLSESASKFKNAAKRKMSTLSNGSSKLQNAAKRRMSTLSQSTTENKQNKTLQKITDPKELKKNLKIKLSNRYKKLEKLKEKNKNKETIKSKSSKVSFTDMTQKISGIKKKYVSFALSAQNQKQSGVSKKNKEDFSKKIFEDIFYNNLKDNYAQIINFYLPLCNDKTSVTNTSQNNLSLNEKICTSNNSNHIIVFTNTDLSELFLKDKKLYNKIIGKLPPYTEKQFLIGLERNESITFEKGLLVLKAGSTVFLDVAFTASIAAIHGIGYAVTGATFAAAAASPIGALAMGGIASMFATHFILDGYRRYQRLNNPRLSFNTKYMPNQGFRAFESALLAKYHKLFYYDEYNFESNYS